jgi:hypothetical protein
MQHTTSRLTVLLSIVLLSMPGYVSAYSGRIVDASTKRPIEGTFVTLHDNVVQTDANGMFQIGGEGDRLGVRASGYVRAWIDVSRLQDTVQEVELVPLTPKALYLSFFGIGSTTLRQAALKLIDTTELNALVIDIKGDRGMIASQSDIPLAHAVGAQNMITVKDIKGLIRSLREQGLYTIARIVVFKDHPLALARPDVAVKTQHGTIWRDGENLAWSDPFNKEVWDYNIAVAVEAARHGFDEIQFDYVRFPDTRGLVFSLPGTEANRVNAIAGFLRKARKQLTPYNVFVPADVFGYVCWNLDDTGVGQTLEALMPLLDYLSPMLYPSCFHCGIPGFRNPVAHPYEVVYRSLKRARERTGLPSTRFRPWLQAFRDYAFDRRPFTAKEIREQIQAAEDFGADGWMLWNPRNVYAEDGLH